MHTAPIATLPIHPTPAVARQESHGDDFSNHLRKEAREISRSDERRPPEHDEPRGTKARPRAPEEDHQPISSDGDTASVAQPETSETPAASQSKAELPDSDTKDSDAVAPLGPLEKAVQPVSTNTGEPEALDIEPANKAQETAETGTTPAQISNPSHSTLPVLELMDPGTTNIPVDGEAIVPSLATALPAPVIGGEKNLPSPSVPEFAATGNTSGAPATDTSPIPATGVTPAKAIPAESSLTGQLAAENTTTSQSAAGTIMAAGGARGGSSTLGQTGGGAAADSLTTVEFQPGEADGESEASPRSTGKPAGTIPVATQASQSTGANAMNGTAVKPQVTTDAGTKEMPALQDMTARGNDMAAQINAPGANQNSNTAAAFGSELKLAGDASLTAETAAARNTPNAAAGQVAVQINRAVQDGQDKFVVNLKPSTLGKVSVQLEVGHDNRVIAVIAAERPETLELLQRDSRALELALKEAGLKTDSGSLSFSLQGDGAEDSPFDDPSGSNHAIAVPQNGDDLDTLPTRNAHAYATDASGVDIHV